MKNIDMKKQQKWIATLVCIITIFTVSAHITGVFHSKHVSAKSLSYKYEITTINPSQNKPRKVYHANSIVPDRENHAIIFTDINTGETIALSQYVINNIASNKDNAD